MRQPATYKFNLEGTPATHNNMINQGTPVGPKFMPPSHRQQSQISLNSQIQVYGGLDQISSPFGTGNNVGNIQPTMSGAQLPNL